MFRSLTVLVFTVALGLPQVVFASPISDAMGNVRWGMRPTELIPVVKGALAKDFKKSAKKAKGPKQNQLKAEYEQRFNAFKGSLTRFTGKSRWDRTTIGEDYTHGNDEAMMVLKGDDGDTYYFFIGDHLWKWVKTFSPSTFGGKNYDKFAKAIQKKFGKGYEKSGEVNSGGDEYKFIEYLDRQSRMRAVDRTSPHGEYALMFEEMATVRDLSALRPNQPKRKARVAKRPEPEPEAAPVATSAKSSARAARDRKSVFDREEKQETPEQYRARVKREQEAERRKARAAYERKQDQKKGAVLDELSDINDDDPLSGMR